MNTVSNQLPAKRTVGRPAKINTLVPPRSLKERATVINDYHFSAEAAYGQACRFAVLCGMELLAAKEQVPHGEWIPWMESNCEFVPQTANKYMLLSTRAIPIIQKKYPVFTELDLMNVAPSLMKQKERELLLSAVREMTDGQTIQDLQLELGIIKPKSTPNLGGPREGAGRPSRLDKQVSDQMMALADWEAISKPLCRYFIGKDAKWMYLTGQQLETVRAVLQGALNTINEGVGK